MPQVRKEFPLDFHLALGFHPGVMMLIDFSSQFWVTSNFEWGMDYHASNKR